MTVRINDSAYSDAYSHFTDVVDFVGKQFKLFDIIWFAIKYIHDCSLRLTAILEYINSASTTLT